MLLLNQLKELIRKKEPGKHPRYEEFMQWQMHGIAEDVFIHSLRPEYTKYVEQAKKNKPGATQDELLQEVESILSQLKG